MNAAGLFEENRRSPLLPLKGLADGTYLVAYDVYSS